MASPYALAVFVAAGSLVLTPFSGSTDPHAAVQQTAATFAASPAGHPTQAAAHSRTSVFEGRTPCGPVATEFTGFPAQNCEKIKWRLTLYRDAASGNPTTYTFDGTRTKRQGRWTIEHRAGPEKNWTVYHLATDRVARGLSLLSVDDSVLLLLGPDRKVLVGDASWSYALNRMPLAER
jgi:hypothetical protein